MYGYGRAHRSRMDRRQLFTWRYHHFSDATTSMGCGDISRKKETLISSLKYMIKIHTVWHHQCSNIWRTCYHSRCKKPLSYSMKLLITLTSTALHVLFRVAQPCIHHVAHIQLHPDLFMLLPWGNKCAPITSPIFICVHLGIYFQHIPRMWYYRRWHKRGQLVLPTWPSILVINTKLACNPATGITQTCLHCSSIQQLQNLRRWDPRTVTLMKIF